jgi:hypothetical protein
VYYGGRNLVKDSCFEAQMSSSIMAPWAAEGPDSHTVDIAADLAHSGSIDASISSTSGNWNAYTQTITVQPGTNYTLTGWVQNNFTGNAGLFGVRAGSGTTVLNQTAFGAAVSYIPLSLMFNSGNNTLVTVFAGFKGQNTSLWSASTTSTFGRSLEVNPMEQALSYEGRDRDQRDAYSIVASLRLADEDGSLSDLANPPLERGDRKIAEIEGWILGIV